jgi:hypothetical protein
MDISETGCNVVWIELAQNTVRWEIAKSWCLVKLTVYQPVKTAFKESEVSLKGSRKPCIKPHHEPVSHVQTPFVYDTF